MLTIGTGVILFFLFYGMKNRNEYLTFLLKVLIIFTVYINIGYFAKIGSFELAYAEVLTFLFVLIGMLLIGRIKIQIVTMVSILVFIASIITGYWLLISDTSPPMVLAVGGSWDNYLFGFESLEFAEFNSVHIKRFIRIILFIPTYYVIDKYLSQNDDRSVGIKKFVVTSAVVFAWVGVIEQITKFFFSSDIVTKIATFVFGIGSSQLVAIKERGGFPALQGFMLEPGHYAQSFIPAIIILFRDPLFSEAKRFKLFLLFGYVLFFSGSFAGFAIFLMMIMLYFWSSKQKVMKKIFAGVVISAATVVFIRWINSPMLNYYMVRVNALLNDESDGTSEGVRMLSIKYAMKLFNESPLFGIGFGTQDAHGFIPSMIANLGILGTTLWFVIMLRGFNQTRTINLHWLILISPVLFFIGDTGTIYSLTMILIFQFVFRKKLAFDEEYTTEFLVKRRLELSR